MKKLFLITFLLSACAGKNDSTGVGPIRADSDCSQVSLSAELMPHTTVIELVEAMTGLQEEYKASNVNLLTACLDQKYNITCERSDCTITEKQK